MSVPSSEARPIRAASATTNWLEAPWFFWLVLALYLAVHIALRLWETPNLGKNDVQEALAAQGWAWGYHPRNPPLHTWLLMGSYAVFGVGLLAHVILKYALLGATYVFAYLAARRVLATHALAVMAALSLTLLTPFAWTVHTALTHTLLLAAMIFATVWLAMRLTAHRRWIDYGLFGVAIGAGLLAKYSYPLFLTPLLAAMLCQEEFRRVLLQWRSLAIVAAAALVCAPHALWMMTAHFDFAAFLAEKQRSEVAEPYLADLAAGMTHVLVGALSVGAPLILLAALFLRRALRGAWASLSPWGRALTLAPVFGLAVLLLDVIVLRATQFEERYFVCVLLVTPLALFVWLDERELAWPDRTLARFGGGILAAALIVFAGVAGRALFYNQSCERCVNEAATGALVHQIRGASGFQHGTIVADHYNVGGNLSIAFPNDRVMAANYIVEHPRVSASGQCLLVWNARNAGDALPAALREFLAYQHLTAPPGSPTYVDAPLWRSTSRMDRFAFWLLPGADGNCEPRRAPVSISAVR